MNMKLEVFLSSKFISTSASRRSVLSLLFNNAPCKKALYCILICGFVFLSFFFIECFECIVHLGPEIISKHAQLSSAEHEFVNAHKYKNIKRFSFFYRLEL